MKATLAAYGWDEVNVLTELDPYVRTINSLTGLDPRYLQSNTINFINHLRNICPMHEATTAY